MDKKEELETIKELQNIAAQMVKDDLEEDPSLIEEYFDCDCCGKYKCVAGSIQYSDKRLCNDCVLLAEIGFKFDKIKNIQELIDAKEDERLEELCAFIKQDEQRQKN